MQKRTLKKLRRKEIIYVNTEKIILSFSSEEQDNCNDEIGKKRASIIYIQYTILEYIHL